MADSNVERIKDRLSINEVVGQYVALKKAGRNYVGLCPFHKERTPSFHVSPERGTYKCFGCGEGGDIFSFVEKLEGIDFPTALRQLAEKAGVTLERQPGAAPQNKEKEERMREVCEEATKFFESKLVEHAAAQKYLAARGVSKETVASWRLGYAPADWRQLSEHLLQKGFSKDEMVDAGLSIRSQSKAGEVHDRFRGRIMFPINDTTGRVIAFSGRFFEQVPGQKEEGEPAKYVNSPETLLFKKSKALYGFDRAKSYIRRLDCILLVEGQFDLILSHQSGLPFAVALSGTALTPEHLSLLSRLSKRLVLALDADAAGVRSGLRSSALALAAGFDVKVPAFEAGKDPADIARENPELLKAAVRTSKTAIEFFLEALRPQAKDERGYQKLVQAQVLPLIAQMESRIESEHFSRIVAVRLGVSEDAVINEVLKLSRGKSPSSEDLHDTQEEKFNPSIPPLQSKIGMLLFHFGKESEMAKRITELLGKERVDEIEKELSAHAELLRFRFDNEASTGASEEAIAGDILRDIEHVVMKEHIRNAGEDTKQISELAKHRQELRK
jgi:DNA primase